ncbi:MAG: Flagellar hook-associated protein 2 [Planctomycetota bacterium]|jgi:flagellar hook-associated protein 2
MSGISSGVGLASGINTGQIIEQLLALDARAKTPLQAQITKITTSKTAMLDVNARLLAARSASSKFRIGRVFEQMKSTVGDESIMTATAKPGTPPGNYSFKVSRLVSTSQMLSRGFASRDVTPLGLTQMNFEFGDAAISRGALLNNLRGGQGVGQGSVKFTDRSGQTETIDLTSSVTLQDVVSKINEASLIGITASIENERVVLRDTSGGTGQLVVTDVGNGTMASKLGIAGSSASSTRTGTAALNALGMDSVLAELNDGNGVLIRDGTVDFQIKAGTTTYDIKLGRTNQPISNATKLTDLNNGVGVRINTTDADDFTVVTSTGVSVGVNLGAVVVDGEVQSPAVTTVGELITRVNSELAATLGSGAVTLSLRSDPTGVNSGFDLVDTLGGGGPLKVLGNGPNTNKTATDLGIYTGPITAGPTTITGSSIPNKVAIPRASTVQDLADRVLEQTSGKVRVEINAAGTGLRLVSTVTTPGPETIEALPGVIDGTFGAVIGERTLRDLGLFGASVGTTVSGSRISSGIATVQVGNINGGNGVTAGAVMAITDRAGNSFSFSDFSSYETLDSLVRAINSDAAAAGVGVTLALSSNGRSLVATDTSGGSGNLSLVGQGAKSLGLLADAPSSTVSGLDLDRQYVSFATRLSSLNFGRGVGSGTFTMKDSTGATATIDIDPSDLTIYDVISEINASGLTIRAEINEGGDGIILKDTNTGTPTTAMEVKDTSGQVARGLGIAKKATTAGGSIDGTFERVVTFAATDTLNDVLSKIKTAGVGVNAAVIDAGSGATPFRLSLTSQFAGSRGQLLVDSVGIDLGMTRTTEGRDAAMVLGGSLASDNPFIFTSSSNTFEGILSGMTVTAKKVGETTVEVTRDIEGTMAAVQAWTKAINDVISKINDYDKYDSTAKTKGPLFGDSTVSIVRQQILTAVQGRAKGITGPYQFLSQVGIKLGAKSQLVIDDTKLRNLIETDASAVEELFSGFEIQQTGSTSPVEGVTIENTRTTYSKLGFGDTFDQLLQRITNTVDGTTTLADRNFQKQIDALKKRITNIDDRLEAKRDRYQRQFAAMERAIARVQTQQSAVSGIGAGASF